MHSAKSCFFFVAAEVAPAAAVVAAAGSVGVASTAAQDLSWGSAAPVSSLLPSVGVT